VIPALTGVAMTHYSDILKEKRQQSYCTVATVKAKFIWPRQLLHVHTQTNPYTNITETFLIQARPDLL